MTPAKRPAILRLLVLFAPATTLLFGTARKSVHVRSYTRKNGTVVRSYKRAAPGIARSRRSTGSARVRMASPARTHRSGSTSMRSARAASSSIPRDSRGRIERSAARKRTHLNAPAPVRPRGDQADRAPVMLSTTSSRWHVVVRTCLRICNGKPQQRRRPSTEPSGTAAKRINTPDCFRSGTLSEVIPGGFPHVANRIRLVNLAARNALRVFGHSHFIREEVNS